MFGQIAEFRFFEKIKFLCFWGAPKKTTFWGVILLKLFDPSWGFKVPRSKSFRSMAPPPKVGFLKPNNVFWAEKSFLGPPKTQKIDFLKKPDFCDLTEHWRWFPQWPWSPEYHQTPVFNSKINYLAVAQCVLAT